jgi:hypothetical protein
MGVLKSVEPTGFLAFAPAFAGTNWADVNRRIIQNCRHGRGRSLVFGRLFGSWPCRLRLRTVRCYFAMAVPICAAGPTRLLRRSVTTLADVTT